MKITRRRAVIILSIISCLVAVWWVFWFPYNPERLYAAFPADVRYISEHDSLSPQLPSPPLMPC